MQEVSKPFKSLHGNPPTDEDREKFNVPFNRSDPKLFQLCAAIDQYDQDMECLESSTWFIDTMKTALDEKKWLIDDKVDEGLPVAYDDGTKRQVLHKNTACGRERKGCQGTRSVLRVQHRSVVRSVVVAPIAPGTHNRLHVLSSLTQLGSRNWLIVPYQSCSLFCVHKPSLIAA